jgi:glycosyltransferase involved in cell wall biosynthesis
LKVNEFKVDTINIMKLTVLTPTYNRSEKIKELFLSLKLQSRFDFTWLVVDDGSIDDTHTIINDLIKGDIGFPVKYIKKHNGGKHSAINYGLTKVTTKYCLIIDSDDLLKPNAIDFFISKWSEMNDESVVAITCLTETKLGTVIGDGFPENGALMSHLEQTYINNIHGDKIECYRTDILQQYMFPMFYGEKFLTEAVVWNRIGSKYKKQCYNESLLIHEYYEDGLTSNLDKLHNGSLLGSALYHYELSNISVLPFKARVKNRSISVKYILMVFASQFKMNAIALFFGSLLAIRNWLK